MVVAYRKQRPAARPIAILRRDPLSPAYLAWRAEVMLMYVVVGIVAKERFRIVLSMLTSYLSLSCCVYESVELSEGE